MRSHLPALNQWKSCLYHLRQKSKKENLKKISNCKVIGDMLQENNQKKRQNTYRGRDKSSTINACSQRVIIISTVPRTFEIL